jgi:hypothetical protein
MTAPLLHLVAPELAAELTKLLIEAGEFAIADRGKLAAGALGAW